MSKQLNWGFWIPGQIGIVSYCEAMPGVAKTASAAALAKQTGRWFLPIMLTQWLPEDLGGFPVAREMTVGEAGEFLGIDPDLLGGQQGKLHGMLKIPDVRLQLARKIPTLCLMDEFGSVPHSTQAAALTIINDGLGANCWMFAAGNPLEAAASGAEITPPMVNRICVVQWEFDIQAHQQGLSNNDVYPTPDVPIVPSDWKTYFGKWGTLVASFLKQYPACRQNFPSAPEEACRPYPSPRSWTNAANCLAAGESVGANVETMQSMTSGLVGNAASVQFWQWLGTQDLPDPEAILANPAMEVPSRGDLLTAIVKSVVGALERESTPERWEAAIDFVEHVYKTVSEEVAMACRGAIWILKPSGYSPKVRKGAWREMDAETVKTSS